MLNYLGSTVGGVMNLLRLYCTTVPPSLGSCFSEKGPGPHFLGPLMAFPQPHPHTHKLLIGWGVQVCAHYHSQHPTTDTFLGEFPMTKPRTHFRSGPGPKGSGCKWFRGPLAFQTCLLERHCRASKFSSHVWAGEHFRGPTLQILTHLWKHMSAHLPSPLEGSPHPRPCLRTTPPQTTINPCLNFALRWGPLQFRCFLTSHSSSIKGPNTKRCLECGSYAFLPSGPLIMVQGKLLQKAIGSLQIRIHFFSSLAILLVFSFFLFLLFFPYAFSFIFKFFFLFSVHFIIIIIIACFHSLLLL